MQIERNTKTEFTKFSTKTQRSTNFHPKNPTSPHQCRGFGAFFATTFRLGLWPGADVHGEVARYSVKSRVQYPTSKHISPLQDENLRKIFVKYQSIYHKQVYVNVYVYNYKNIYMHKYMYMFDIFSYIWYCVLPYVGCRSPWHPQKDVIWIRESRLDINRGAFAHRIASWRNVTSWVSHTFHHWNPFRIRNFNTHFWRPTNWPNPPQDSKQPKVS